MLSISVVTILLVLVLATVLGLITLLNNAQRTTNRMFAALSILSGVYSVVNYLADHDQVRSLFWVRGTFALAVILLLLMVLFLNGLPRRFFGRGVELVFVAVAGLVAAISYAPQFIPKVELTLNRAEVMPGPLYPLFITYILAALVLTVWLIRRQMSRSKSLERVRVKYVAGGLTLTVLLVATTNLFLPLATGNNNLAALGSYFILVFIGVSAFAMVKHRLFDIRLLVARSLTYVLLLMTLAALYGAALFTAVQLLFPEKSESIGQVLITTMLAVILAFTFQPLRRFFERITDRVFYRDRYDSQVVLGEFSKILVSELDLDRILKRSLTQFCRDVHIQYGQVVVFNHDRVYRVEHVGPLPRRLMVAPELHQLRGRLLVADELSPGKHKRLLDGHGIRVALTLRTRDEFIGYLLLGDKLSGDIYSAQDIDILEIVGKQLAVAILNAKAYAEIREFNVTLQARVDHATNRLRVANRHLKELDKAKDEFISMASHQLRTPLTTIKGYLSMMLEGDAGRLSKTQREFTDYAFGSSERMVNLISDLLNVSRLSAGRFLIQARPTDMVAMVADEVRQLQSHAAAKHLKLTFEPPTETLPLLEVDDNKTRQVIMNFIDNAIYYTPAGSVRVVLSRVGPNIRLEVIDTGIGVPADQRRKLFSKFYRASNAQSMRPDGTGLGLYLARRVVQDQGGTIIFTSTEGKGSTFGFELPFKAAPVASPDHG